MGTIVCEKHGPVESLDACTHVARQIKAGAPPSGRRLAILGTLLVCEECFASLHLATFENLARLPRAEAVKVADGSWEAYGAAYEAIEGRERFCMSCVGDLEQTSSQSAPATVS